MVRHVSSGSSFEEKFGYSRAVVDGDMVYVSGCTGYDYSTMELPPDVEGQTRNTLANIVRALEEAGSTLNDVLRVRYYLPRREYADTVAPLLGRAFASARPAATLIIAGLIEEKIKIEIEVTARIGAGASQ